MSIYLSIGAVCIVFLLIQRQLTLDYLSIYLYISDLIGFLYPFYASIKAIESSDAKDESIWLTYWLIFGLFKIFEEFGDVFLSYIPFYRVIKATFLIWAFYSKTQGANTVYTNLIKPYVVPALGILSTSDDDSKKEHKQ